jgi:hypothetical protein
MGERLYLGDAATAQQFDSISSADIILVREDETLVSAVHCCDTSWKLLQKIDKSDDQLFASDSDRRAHSSDSRARQALSFNQSAADVPKTHISISIFTDIYQTTSDKQGPNETISTQSLIPHVSNDIEDDNASSTYRELQRIQVSDIYHLQRQKYMECLEMTMGRKSKKISVP